jgi:drug/metabolite transporter (DMT)-like permease
MPRRAWILLALLAAIWGASYMFIKVALDDGLSEPFIVFARTLLGAAVLIPLAIKRDALRALRGSIAALTLLVVIQIVVPFLLITAGENHISSSMAGILVSSAPIFTALLAIRLDQAERSRGWALVGVVVGMLGVVLLFGLDLSGDAMAILGGGMVLLASLGYAVGGLTIKRRFGDVQPVGLAAASMALAALITAPFAAISAPTEIAAGSVGALLALGAGGTGIAFFLFYTLIAEVGPARASVVAYVAPGFAVAYGVTLLGESLTLGAIAGLLLILAGSWLGAEGRLPRWLGPFTRLSRSGPSRSSAPAPARAR